MIGKHKIIIANQKVHFNLDLTRNITIIRGDSATGKTTLISMLSDYENQGKQSGVTVKCDKPCRVLTAADWEIRLAHITDSIVFIDEGNKFVKSTDFARAIRNSNNYYVIITRESLCNLPYSVDEIYEMHVTRHSKKFEKVYNGTRRFYSDIPTKSHNISNTDLIVTEDSNSGYEFFLHIANKKGINCRSAYGKSNLFNILANTKEKLTVIADGAAFGCEIDKISKLQEQSYGRITLYLPESFEWLILKSDVLRMQDIAEILSAPENHIDSSVYFSWEQFFTHLLSEKTKETYMQYSKEHLAEFYLKDKNIQKILAEIEL
jgi:hypothetical protein